MKVTDLFTIHFCFHWSSNIHPLTLSSAYHPKLRFCTSSSRHPASQSLAVGIWILTTNTFIISCMFLLYLEVLFQEIALDRYNISINHNCDQSKCIATQGIYLSSTYSLTYITSYVKVYMDLASISVPKWLVILAVILYPTQCLYNTIVYPIPRYLRSSK